ncbi:MAG: polyribonucleotide nucleotidyltransferase [Anaerolineae bacterium]
MFDPPRPKSPDDLSGPAPVLRRIESTERVYTCDVGGRTFTFKTGKLAQLAGGTVTCQIGDTIVLATSTTSKGVRDIDFMPLSVEFDEKMYAAGRIPGSFFRREGRPSETAILTARLIDRPLRPLFPEGMRNDVQIITSSLSSDGLNYLDIPAMNAASAALMVSDVPFPEPIAGVRVGLVDGNLVMNPTTLEMENSKLDLRLAATQSAILMVECGAAEVDEETMLAAIRAGHAAIQPLYELQNRMRAEVGKAKADMHLDAPPADLEADCAAACRSALDAIVADATLLKDDRNARVDEVQAAWQVAYLPGEEGAPPAKLGADGKPYMVKHVKSAFKHVLSAAVRERILTQGIRPDGRQPREIRPLSAEVGLLPRVHGSALFQRGETQVMSLATLGPIGEGPKLDSLRPETLKRWMHHYNFPPFSTGETWPMRGPRRREIGHGALVESALKYVLPGEDVFPYTIRVVSECLASNGSTSQASVCASTLALMDAGVPLKAPVAGIAMGLISDPDAGRHVVLTDIQGMEDHLGDMDFKVAGTADGITALQMDIKIGGIPDRVLHQALAQAREARLLILGLMTDTLAAPRPELSPFAPRIMTLKIPADSIGKLIGPGGKNVRMIEEQTGVKVDIQNDGTVYVASSDGAAAEKARGIIEGLTAGRSSGRSTPAR